MDKSYFIDMLEKYQASFASRELVVMLTDASVNDYERGRIRGQIEMLTKLMQDLASNEADTVQE